MRGSKNAFGIIPWLDHGIQKTIKNIKIFSILIWIPQSSRGMTAVELIHATMPHCEERRSLDVAIS
ncbi:hypothetical protein [Rickettsia tamurae]|uniref:hypothetical protein n=1 Tax=Rickettsia tamurae TaxID=334545 RepID=UPI0002ECAB3F|nr:hypothetical protein [Rickettsia tamurae]